MMADFLRDAPIYPNVAFETHQGVGMTSQRTRNRLVQRLFDLGIRDEAVLNAIRVTPRHVFLDEAMATRAYEDTALPIGYGQTISQPWVVAKMTAWLFAKGDYPMQKVLEIGTGSGYQTAILALLADVVYTLERIEPLHLRAQNALAKLGLRNIAYDLSDGHWGWPAQSPYDGIISAASPEQVPEELFAQLRDGGRLIMPIGGAEQLLYGFTKTSTGYTQECLGEVLFVPMKQGVEA